MTKIVPTILIINYYARLSRYKQMSASLLSAKLCVFIVSMRRAPSYGNSGREYTDVLGQSYNLHD